MDTVIKESAQDRRIGGGCGGPPCSGCINQETISLIPDIYSGERYVQKGIYYIKVVGYNGTYDKERSYSLSIGHYHY